MNKTELLALTCPLSTWTGTPGNCHWCDTKLPAGSKRTAWCGTKCSRAFETEHNWRKARILARRKAKYVCSRPGCTAARKDIEINHINPRNNIGYAPDCGHHQSNLEALCKMHHQQETNRQRQQRKQQTLPP